jgi:hypothetical protein
MTHHDLTIMLSLAAGCSFIAGFITGIIPYVIVKIGESYKC